jgi:hypothetical protein
MNYMNLNDDDYYDDYPEYYYFDRNGMDRTMQNYSKLVEKRNELNELRDTLFKRVEHTEEAFRNHFSQIKHNLIQVDLGSERHYINEFFRNPNHLTNESLAKIKYEYEQKICDVRKRCESFKYFEFDLFRNRHRSTIGDNLEFKLHTNQKFDLNVLGELELCSDFLKNTTDQIENVIVCSKGRSQCDISVFNLNTHTLVKKIETSEHVETWCLTLYGNDKLITGGSDKYLCLN